MTRNTDPMDMPLTPAEHARLLRKAPFCPLPQAEQERLMRRVVFTPDMHRLIAARGWDTQLDELTAVMLIAPVDTPFGSLPAGTPALVQGVHMVNGELEFVFVCSPSPGVHRVFVVRDEHMLGDIYPFTVTCVLDPD